MKRPTGIVVVAILMYLGATLLAVGYLWRPRAWARTASITCIGFGMIFALLGILLSLPDPFVGVLAWQVFVVAVDLGFLLYLTRPHVAKAFGT